MLAVEFTVVLPVSGQSMPETRHEPVAPTRAQWLTPGAAISAHRHDEHQIVYARRGVLVVTTGFGTWVAPANRAIWVPAGTVHAHRARGRLELHLVGLPADRNPLGLDEPAVLSVGPLLRELILARTRPRTRTGPPARTPEPTPDCAPDGTRPGRTAPHRTPDRPSGLDGPEQARLLAVLLDQLRVSSRQPLHVPVPVPSAPELTALEEILRADPADTRTLAELGKEVGASSRTLSRLFRSDLGMTFPQWRTQLRLRHALVLLAEDRPVTAVAHLCGWSSASAFIDVFRRTFGCTPGAHREAGGGRETWPDG